VYNIVVYIVHEKEYNNKERREEEKTKQYIDIDR
jgi:hypothetical protein